MLFDYPCLNPPSFAAKLILNISKMVHRCLFECSSKILKRMGGKRGAGVPVYGVRDPSVRGPGCRKHGIFYQRNSVWKKWKVNVSAL